MAERKKQPTKATTAAPAASVAAPAPATIDPKLVVIAVELNTLLGLAPAIPTEGVANDEIAAKIKEGSVLVTLDDKKDITPGTWTYLENNGCLDHLKPAAPTAAKAAKAAAKADKNKPVPPKADPNKFTRVKALAGALQSGAEIKDMATKSDSLYVVNGGKTNLNIATWDFGFARKLLTLLGYATEKDGKLILK